MSEAAARCSSARGPAMVEVRAPNGGAYCIDSTEVTKAQYAAFLADAASAPGQPPECQWNTSYVPPADWPTPGRESYPVTNVDWCDARAFCLWSGKRLCGKIGGGSNDFNSHANAVVSQWFNACSAGGTKAFPYGNTYVGNACVGSDFDGTPGSQSTDVVRPVGYATGCVGGVPGLFDMSGNVHEWEDSCEGSGPDDLCRLRGGAPGGAEQVLRCDMGFYNGRNGGNGPVGFRCCKE
jgi:formylglycine-generating enzyme required for sulfatase activity